MWAYGGWNGLNTLIEEVKNPEKNLVRSLMISVPLVTLCYVLMNLAYFIILSKEEFLSSDAVALTFAIRLNSFLGTTMPFIVALSCFGTLNVDIFASSRILFSIAREKQLPSCFAMVHRQTQAPIPALLFRAVLSLIMLLPTNIENLLNWLSFIDWLIFSAVFIGLLVLAVENTRRSQTIQGKSCHSNFDGVGFTVLRGDTVLVKSCRVSVWDNNCVSWTPSLLRFYRKELDI